MIFGSVCSGIEAASVAWEPLGWRPAWFSEIAPWPSKFLKTRFPLVPNRGSLIGLADRLAGADRRIELLVGGTPCQSYSVAGNRKGRADPRGNLTYNFARLAEALRPRWIVWENVPGVLSAERGAAFGSLLGDLAQLGYGFAWRVLDAQFFRVAQRRERVFLVGCLGSAAGAGAVLFEPEGVRRNPPPRRETGEEIAGTLGAGSGGFGGDLDRHGAFIPEIAECVTGSITHTLTSNGCDASEDGTGRGTPIVACFDETQITSPTNRSSAAPHTAALTRSGRPPTIAFNARQDPVPNDFTTGALDTDGTSHGVAVGSRVRRLTPKECERLQGFPDDWTNIEGAKDTPRYAALGNSMAVPVMAFIGRRIQMVDEILFNPNPRSA